MSNKRRKARWRRSRALLTASNPVANQAVPAGALPALPSGWARWSRHPRVTLVTPPPSVWVPEDCNRHLKSAARGEDTIGYPLHPPAPIPFPPPSYMPICSGARRAVGARC